MTREEILKKGVYIVLPNSDSTYRQYNVDAIKFPFGERYTTWKMNQHHFTTKYHREQVMPLLAKLLHFKFDVSEYHLVEAMSDGFDISQLYPNEEMSFNLWGINDNDKLENAPFEKIVENPYKTYDITGFHKLYRYSHKNSVVTNNNGGNGKTLLISGDSNIIPSVPTLCTIFKQVWYIDNRANVEVYKYFKDVDFDEILFELNWNDLSHYITKNLKQS